MKQLIFTLVVTLGFSPLFAQNIPSKEMQIKTAVLAAPDELRSQATVLGYDQSGKLVELRKGTNDLICLADDPSTKGFNVSCYHKSLEPFMIRGRELKAQGKTFQEIFDAREAEAKSGKLKMPEKGTTLYSLTTSDENYNRQTGTVSDTYLRYVVYIPWSTAEDTGLPLKPTVPGMPWIMDPGTHRAHIMISPPKN